MLCPYGHEILYVELSHEGTPHSVVTTNDTYDMDEVSGGSIYYHSSGSGTTTARSWSANSSYGAMTNR